LYPLSPICAETVNPHIGRRVCVVMKDGTRHVGVLRGFGDDQLYLERDGDLTLSAAKKNRRSTKKKSKAQTTAFWGGPYGRGWGWGWGWGVAAFSLGLIAGLFLLPFFFV